LPLTTRQNAVPGSDHQMGPSTPLATQETMGMMNGVTTMLNLQTTKQFAWNSDLRILGLRVEMD